MRKLCLLILFLSGARLVLGQTPACTNTINSYPYFEQFANGQGGWVSGGLNSSWALGYPTGKMEMYYTASDSNSWMTSLTGYYNANENSHVVSPCFNFTNLADPVIEMKIWWNSEAVPDGAVLQSSINNGLTWQVVGNYGDPYNWYNGNSLNAGPGGQQLNQVGWTGRVGSAPGNGSRGWVLAKHKLNGLGGAASVRLRIAFASDFQYEDDGFAFDDIRIYENPQHDAGIVGILTPQSACGLASQEHVRVVIKNYGQAVQNAVPVTYQFGTNPPVTEITSTPILPDDSLTYTFTTKLNASVPNTYKLKAFTGLPNDAVHANDTARHTFTAIPTITSYPYIQNFESGNGGWLASGTNSSWALGTPSKITINSAASGANSWVTNLTGNYNQEEDSRVVGPCFNFSTLINPLLTMKVWWNTKENTDGAVLQSSIDGGLTWQNVGAFGDPYNWFNSQDISSEPGDQSFPAPGWSGTNMSIPSTGSNGWVTVKHLLTGLGGQTNVKLRIAFASDAMFMTDDGFAFDDVAIYENPAHDVGIIALVAPVSSTCGAGNQESVTVTIKNYGSATQTSIPVTYQIGSNAPVTGTFTGSLLTDSTANFTFPTQANLSAGGNFALRVSTALPADTFTTNNNVSDTIRIFNPIATFPYEQNFENLATGTPVSLPAGWQLKTGTAQFYPYSWEVHSGPTPMAATGPAYDHTLGNLNGKYFYANGSAYPAGDSTELITPCIDLASLTNPGFSFWYHLAGADIDRFQVQVSSNNGLTWTTLYTLNGPQQTSETEAWRKKVISLQGYSGKIKLKFKARLGTGIAGDIAIDDFRFYNLPATDLEVFALSVPEPGCGLTAAENVCVSIMNVGTAAQTGFTLNYKLNNGPVISETFTGTLLPGATTQYCFNTKANMLAAGPYQLVAYTQATGDADPTNDTLRAGTHSIPTISTLPYAQNFENGNSHWIARGVNSSWALGTPAKTVINSAASGSKAWVTSLTGPYNAHENSYVVGPCFNFSALAGDPDFEMKAWWNSQRGFDGAVVQTSIDGGTTWQNVGEFNDPNNWYNDSTIYSQPGDQPNYRARGWSGTQSDGGSNGWVKVKHKLTGMAGKPSVQIRIAFAANGWLEEEGFAFDDIRIIDNSQNLAVNSLAPLAANCGYSASETLTVELENLGATPIANANMQFKVNNGAPVTATFAGPLAGGAKTNFTFPAGANLSSAGNLEIKVIANNLNDPDRDNDTLKYQLKNPLYATFPLNFDFETAATGLTKLQLKANRFSAITDGAGASFGTGATGMIMDGISDTSWIMPVGQTATWSSNPDHFAGAYFCVTPAGFAPNDSLWLEFDLKQLYQIANANTNFRVTVNGTQTGITHRPPFGGGPATWKHVKIPLTTYISQGTMQIGLESSVNGNFDNGNGPANLIDNIRVSGNPTLGTKENLLQKAIVIYPNPSTGIFNLNLPETKGTYELEVRELSGKVVKRETISAGKGAYRLILQGAAKGIYILKIASGNSVAVQKLVLE